jgi:hypothetical protein
MTFAPFWRDVVCGKALSRMPERRTPSKILMLVELWTRSSQSDSVPMGSERQIRSRRLH